MKKKIRFLICVLLVVSLLYVFSGCEKLFPIIKTFPDYGIWYSEDLQLYLNFERDAKSLAIIDGKEIKCVACYMDGSSNIVVDRILGEDPDYGKPIFWGDFVSSDDTELVLRSNDDNKIYSFIKVDSRTGDDSLS